MTATSQTPPGPIAELPFKTRLAIFVRLLAIQGSWNYESLLGNGIGFCVEPALRLFPEGIHSDRFKTALARESQYFNAHPYLASVAVGALARAELDGEPPQRIERFRTALCGPLGSVGDRLVWAGWLPFCSLASLAIFGLGASAPVVVGFFLLVYNAGHFGLRAWGLRTGWKHGLRVASALGNPVLAPWTGADWTVGRARHGYRDSAVARQDHWSRPQSARRRVGGGRARRVRRRPPEGSHRRLEALARRARCFRPRLGDRLMPERTVQIVNRNGLHARPAAEIVKLASKFQSEITIVKDDLDVNGKSIMGVMMLAAEHGSSITLRAEGPDAPQALDALATLVSNKFGES